MKKIILGLFFTVGVSSFALAENSMNKSFYEQDENYVNTIDSNSKKEVSEIDIEELFQLNCATQYITRSYNCDGSFETILGGYFEHDCGSNEEEGQLTFSISAVDGCPTGGE